MSTASKRVVPAWARAGVGLLAGCLVVTACTSTGDPSGQPTTPSGPPGSGRIDPPASTDPALAQFYDQSVHWKGCGDGFDCSAVRVPLDYSAPGGPEIRLSVVRLRARGGDRLGSLFVNPGGPGASGLDYARAADAVVSAPVRKRFDIVGFDPRGVGASAPIRCLTDAQTDAFVSQDGSPDDATEEDRLQSLARALGRHCAARNGELLRHVGTRDSARDLDVLRQVVGDRRLNLLGKSYGTYLGATYAELFPARVGRLVLDGVVDPASDTTDLALAQAEGFERALRAFVDDCLPRRSCPLTGDRAAALAQVSDLLTTADSAPLRGARPVTQSLALLGVAYAMYEPSLWEVLREALREAAAGNGSLLLLIADSYLERNQDGHYRSNSNDAYFAIGCLDRAETSDLATVRARAARLRGVAPRFGAYVAWELLPCGFWPVPPEGDPHPVHATGAAPILVVGTTRDPATPYAAARSLAAQLDSGRLLTYDGDGHTAYAQGSACIDDAVDAFLLHGTLPPEGTRCR